MFQRKAEGRTSEMVMVGKSVRQGFMSANAGIENKSILGERAANTDHTASITWYVPGRSGKAEWLEQNE